MASIDDVHLLPCPLCGGGALGNGYEWPPLKGHVQCFDCNLYVVSDTEAEAIAAWNRRSPSPAVGDLVEALRSLEGANEALCARRSLKTYDSMRMDGCEEQLFALDAARKAARVLLSTHSPKEMEQATRSPEDGQEA